MDYILVNPPLEPDFQNMSSAEARAYFRWFVDQIPTRVAVLQTALLTSADEPFELDYSVESLRSLGVWFQGQVRTRQRSASELAAEKARMPEWFQGYVTGWTLTDETISLCIDSGMYFGEVALRAYPEVHWDYARGRKRDVNLNQPVLKGFLGRVDVNPVQLMLTMAYGVVDGKDVSENLLRAWNARNT